MLHGVTPGAQWCNKTCGARPCNVHGGGLQCSGQVRSSQARGLCPVPEGASWSPGAPRTAGAAGAMVMHLQEPSGPLANPVQFSCVLFPICGPINCWTTNFYNNPSLDWNAAAPCPYLMHQMFVCWSWYPQLDSHLTVKKGVALGNLGTYDVSGAYWSVMSFYRFTPHAAGWYRNIAMLLLST